MKILSFDVGIKNLAGIILEYDEKDDAINLEQRKISNIQTDKIKIIDWRIINLLDEFQNENKCCFVVSKILEEETSRLNDEYCGKNATKVLLNKDYCNKHFKNISKNYSFENVFNTIGDKYKCDCNYNCKVKNTKYKLEKIKNIELNFMDKYNPEKELYFCSTHFKHFKKEFEKNKKIKKVNCDDVKTAKLELNMWKRLDDLPELLDVDLVLIENQPQKNLKMREISNTLFNYFLCRGIVDKSRTNSTINDILDYNASNKLKMEEDSEKELKGLKSDKRYRITKKLSKEYTTELVKRYPEYEEMYNNSKKKDDLADCILQGIHYIYFGGKKIE